MSIVVVTGTGSGAGKTLAISALAAASEGPVAAVKLAQTGGGRSGDLFEITRLSGCRDVHEFARYPGTLPPHHAARAAGLPELQLAEAVRQLIDLDADAPERLVLVEGSGGLLTPFTALDGWTLPDLAVAVRAPALVVARPGSDAAAHAALVTGRLAEDGVPIAGLVLAGWPDGDVDDDLRCALDDLAGLAPDGELAAVLPSSLGDGRDFRRRARRAVAPRFGGTFDWSAFRASLSA